MYTSTTSNVTVSVEPTYLPQESEPERNVYVWSYKVQIRNDGEEPVQLRSRYWKITDAYGRSQEVHGPGVIGEQPLIEPGASFEYTSGTPLNTSNGIMVGAYSMQTPDGRLFDVAIPAFSLDMPQTPRQVH